MRWLALCLALSGCGPSCAERGGKWAQDGYSYVPQIVGKITIMQTYPNYVCVIEGKNNAPDK